MQGSQTFSELGITGAKPAYKDKDKDNNSQDRNDYQQPERQGVCPGFFRFQFHLFLEVIPLAGTYRLCQAVAR